MCMAATALATIFTLSSFSLIDEDEFDFEAILKSAAAEQDAECPIDIGEGMTMEYVDILNHRLTYLISSPTYIVESFNMLKEMDSAGTTKMMLEAMLEGGDEVAFLFLTCAEANYGIEFIYKSNDGQQANIILSPKELSDTLNDKYTEKELESIIYKLFESYM